MVIDCKNETAQTGDSTGLIARSRAAPVPRVDLEHGRQWAIL
jgi:hypothetical protein